MKKEGDAKAPEAAGLQLPQTKILPRPRPEITSGMTERMRIGCGNLYVTVNYDENGICEVFTSTGKAGGCPSQSEATARLVSIALRSGIDLDEIIDQLRGIRCPSTIRQSGCQLHLLPGRHRQGHQEGGGLPEPSQERGHPLRCGGRPEASRAHPSRRHEVLP